MALTRVFPTLTFSLGGSVSKSLENLLGAFITCRNSGSRMKFLLGGARPFRVSCRVSIQNSPKNRLRVKLVRILVQGYPENMTPLGVGKHVI